VTDQLYLSMWLPEPLANWRTRYFQKILSIVPFSQREQPQSTLSIQAISQTEPSLLERPLNGPVSVADLTEILDEYTGEDVAYCFESWWDLWQYNGQEWEIKPAKIILSSFGKEFDNGGTLESAEQEDLRVDFGVDTLFLPDPSLKGSSRLTESNVKSLLKLVHDIEEALPVERRVLETESGENFAEKLARHLSGQSLPQ
jgi:hypothetical protein